MAERLVKIMQFRAFSKRSYKTTETCFCLKFTGFVTHFLKLLSNFILSKKREGEASHEYDLLRYCRLSLIRNFTENSAHFLDTMMLTLFFFKPILPVGTLIEVIIGDLLGKY